MKFITIHPYYIYEGRKEQDIALIETIQPFDFSFKEKVSPICLPSMTIFYFIDFYQLLIEAPDTKDRGVKVAVSGWGNLYEKPEGGKPKCFTRDGGPEEFKECRGWFKYDGELLHNDGQCQTSDPPSSNQECRDLYKEFPAARFQLAKVKVKDKTVRLRRKKN